jgi:spermidine synthase
VNEDARWFMMRGGDPYDLIFIDAFNDLSVPYHLTTREFTAQVRKRLAPDGALVANVIDNFVSGRFLASYVKTLRSVFGEKNVTVMYETEESLGDVQSTFVVIASPSLDALLSSIQNERAFSHRPVPAASPLSQSVLQRYLRQRQAIVLTDDYVPVDNMLAPLFADRFADETSGSE